MATMSKTSPSGTLGHVRDLLDQSRPEDALDFINHHGQETSAMENARAVCLMRLGRLSEATSILRDIAFRGYVCMPDDTPLLFQLNFATAMLMANFKDAAIAIMDRLDSEQAPQALKLKGVIQRWKASIGPLGRLRCRLGFYPKKPVSLDFPPGQA